MKKRTITILVLFGLISTFGYSVTGMIQTHYANEIVDEFFAEFSVNESAAVQRHLLNIEQTDYLSILERHREALRNFTYEKSTPDLHFTLNRATVPVSWHLTIVMKRGASGWHIVFLDESASDKIN